MSPYPLRLAFITKPMMPSVEAMTKGDTPSERILRRGFRCRPRMSRLSRSVLGPYAKKCTIHAALTPWERTVAMAAPRTPIPNEKISSGSSAMLSAAPITTDIMAVTGRPATLMKGLSPTVTITKTVPST